MFQKALRLNILFTPLSIFGLDISISAFSFGFFSRGILFTFLAFSTLLTFFTFLGFFEISSRIIVI